jgi:hypothetical protein
MNNNDDETQNMNLPLTPVTEETQILPPPPPLPLMEESQDNLLPPPPITEETQNELLPPLPPPPITEEPQMDVPIISEENDSNLSLSEPVLPEESVNVFADDEMLKNNVAEELYQENSIPLSEPIAEPIAEEVKTEEVINNSPIDSIKLEITKEKLDDLLTKISEETVNYLMLLTNFLEKKRQFNTDTEKIDKTIEDINKIKDDMIKVLTETELTSNGFDPSSGAHKSQYAEMILGALALTAAVSGGKRKKTRKHKKTTKPSNTKKHNNKKQDHKTRINKKSIKKSTTKKNKENQSH